MVLTGPVIRRRIVVVLGVFCGLMFLLVVRLFFLQVVQAEALQRRAQAQWTSESVIEPTRGEIQDRNGTVLAQSATSYIASVSPRQVADAARLAEILSPILDMEEGTIYARASDKTKGGVTLKRQLSREIAQQLKAMMAEYRQKGLDDLNGLYLEEDSTRYYPMGQFAAQILGLTTVDGVGQSGLEMQLDSYLSGKSGVVVEEIDGKGRELNPGESQYVAAVDGAKVVLTIDASIQSFAEQAAREAMSVMKAKAVRALAMNPQTGEILAMVNKPDYDPNNPPRNNVETLSELMRNRVLSDAYEPGSTFKVITSSAALNEGLTNPSEGFYCSGSFRVAGGKIRCWGRPHGAETMKQALQNSCNPVFAELGLRLGAETFYDYLNAFGFGQKTGVDLAGEADGILISKSSVTTGDMARIGFGQSVAVTPIQLLTAGCAVVNGGYLLKPYVLKEIVSGEGEILEAGQRTVRSQPISEKTSKTMRDMLESVVELGGGKNAYIQGYRVGGKTGTAQVYVNGQVSTDTHIGSFIGFAPMDNPVIAVLFIVEEADVAVDYGSVTAAPYARDILEKSLVYLGIAPETSEKSAKEVSVPSVTGLLVKDAISILKDTGLGYVLDGSGATVKNQLPAAGASMAEGSLVMLYVEKSEDAAALNALVSVPDVTGLTVGEANRLLTAYGLKMTIEGSGVAVRQSPAAGKTVYPTTLVTVAFEAP